ncbi:MAG TPA: hypothetical protein VH062_00755 [Polyangiaceae bacterium]|jgi:hypothetical protein|nr:hypothetical protein [Polyangiaceae bacterium]
MTYFDPTCLQDIRAAGSSNVEYAGSQSAAGAPSATRAVPTHATHSVFALVVTKSSAAPRNIEAQPLQGRAVPDPTLHDRLRENGSTSNEIFPVDAVVARIRGFAGNGYRSSYGVAPGEWAIDTVTSIARMLCNSSLSEPRVVPMADGGISLVFSRAGRVARVDVTNEEDIVLTKRSNTELPPEYFEVARDDVARLLSEFFA